MSFGNKDEIKRENIIQYVSNFEKLILNIGLCASLERRLRFKCIHRFWKKPFIF